MSRFLKKITNDETLKEKFFKENILVETLAKMNESELNILCEGNLEISELIRQELSKLEIEQNLK